MSYVALVMGESGSGKSSGIRTLNPKETFIINTLGKALPFKGSGKMYTLWDKEKNPNGNMVCTSYSAATIQWLNYINTKMPHIKNVILEDNTHQSSMEFIRRIKESTWDKWNDIAANMVTIADLCTKLREDLCVFILHHVTTEGDGILTDKVIKAQTLGQLVDKKLSSYESLFTTILLAQKSKTETGDIEYNFLTRSADSTAKTPMGMFENASIPNDLGLVAQTMREYYGEELVTSIEQAVINEKVKSKV